MTKVFLSWSGDRSKMVAEALRKWLRDVIQQVEPWISSKMDGGVFWQEELRQNLGRTSMAVICVTRDNRNAPFLLFEAGALANEVRPRDDVQAERRAIPYLLDLKPTDLDGPLAMLQAKQATREDTLALVQALNSALDKPLDHERLERAFEMHWPALEAKLEEARALTEAEPAGEVRTEKELLEELVEHSRALMRDLERRGHREMLGRALEELGRSNSPSLGTRRYAQNTYLSEAEKEVSARVDEVQRLFEVPRLLRERPDPDGKDDKNDDD